jgi:hypothetical protein
MEMLFIRILSNLEAWFMENIGTIQFLQFMVPLLISLISIRFIKTKSKGPVLVLDIKHIKDYPEEEKEKIQKENYLITEQGYNLQIQNDRLIIDKGYLLQIRNEGDSVALNIHVDSKNFTMVKCESHQIGFGAHDEKIIKIIKKSNEEIKDIKELDSEIFKIYGETLEGEGFYFEHEVVDAKEKKVRFLSKKRGKFREKNQK